MRPWRRFRQFLHGRSFEAELAEELRIHRDMAEAAAVRAGATPEEARRAARREFGGVALTLEDSRAVWRFAWLSSLMQDIRFGLRGIRKSPGFALTVILTLALGLGTLGASFSVFNALVLRPFAVRDPYSLYQLLGWGEKPGSYQTRPLGWRAFNDLRQRNGAFSEVLGFDNVNSPVDGKFVIAHAVTGNYFTMLGGRVCMGRPIMESDDVPGNGVAVASDSAWKSKLGGAPDAIGRRLRVGNSSVEVVGVACPEFNGVEQQRTDFWFSLPLSGVFEAPTGGIEPAALTVVGRLKPGMTPKGAEAALAAYGQQVYSTWSYIKLFPHSATLRQCATVYPLNRDSIAIFFPVFVAFGLVLLIACANVSNMMLARGLARQREIGIRVSLGAGRARVLRQLLTEGLLLALPAALSAFWVAHAAIRAALWFQSSVLHAVWRFQMPLWNAAPDWRVLGFLVVAAGTSTLVFALIPALQTLRTRLVDANRGEFADWRPARLRGILVVAQVAVCALLLIAAGVMVRGERRLASQNMGLDVRGVFRVHPAVVVDNGLRVGPAAARLAAERLHSLPQIAALAVCELGPGMSVRLDSMFFNARAESGAQAAVALNGISPEYLEIFGVPLRGRNFTAGEAEAGAPVTVISETAARRLFPSRDPLGSVVEVDAGKLQVSAFHGEKRRAFRVVGVVPDSSFLYNSEDRAGRARGMLLFPTSLGANGFASFIVRLNGDPAAGRRAMESALRQAGLDGSDMSIGPIQLSLDTYLYPYRALLAISGFLGALALLLTVSGVFGVSSYAVAQRRKEFGIRIALGAGDAQVIGLVLRQSLRFAAAGAALGTVAAVALARAIGQAVPRIDFFDAGGYIAGALVVMASAIGAAWIPARRAVRVDPVETLRCD